MLLQKGNHHSGIYKHELRLPDAECLFALCSTDKASAGVSAIKGDMAQQQSPEDCNVSCH